MTEQAEKDPIIESDETLEATEAEPEGQVDAAPAEVKDTDSQFVSDVSEKTQKRINKITAEKYAEKRRADEAEKALTELKTQTPIQPKQTGQEPKLEDYDYDEAAHTSALIDYRVNLKADQIQQQRQQEQRQTQEKQTADNFNLKVAAFAEKATDYEQVVANIPQLPPETLDAVMQSDKGPELAYYLGKHLDVADDIATASPMVAAMKLGHLSAQLAATTKTVNTSAAPEPIEPIESGGSLPSTEGGPSGATYE